MDHILRLVLSLFVKYMRTYLYKPTSDFSIYMEVYTYTYVFEMPSYITYIIFQIQLRLALNYDLSTTIIYNSLSLKLTFVWDPLPPSTHGTAVLVISIII